MENVMIHPWEYAVKPFNVVSNIYFVGTSYVSSYLINTEEGLILLDTGLPQTTYLLLESIRQLDLDPLQLKYIIHTHSHYDHIGATRAIMELTGAESFMGKDDIDALYDEDTDLVWAKEYGVEFYELFDVAYHIEDGQIIRLGNTEIECMHSPGHTAGTFSFFINVQEHGEKYRCGLFGGPGLNTLSTQYLLTHNLPFTRRPEYLNTIKRLNKETVDIYIPSHPKFSGLLSYVNNETSGKNRFSHPNEWTDFLRGCSKGIEKLLASEYS